MPQKLEKSRICTRICYFSDSDRLYSIYLYSIRKLPEVVVLPVVESDRVGVVLGELATIQALLKSRQAVKSASKVTGEYQDDDDLDGSAIQRGGQIIPEPAHAAVFWVIDGVVWIVRIYSSTAQCSIEPRSVS